MMCLVTTLPFSKVSILFELVLLVFLLSLTPILVGVPGYRISQMVANGGKITDAYGLVNVISPSGLPLRGIVGLTPDPMMLLAVNCINVKESQAFYAKLGFVEQVRDKMILRIIHLPKLKISLRFVSRIIPIRVHPKEPHSLSQLLHPNPCTWHLRRAAWAFFYNQPKAKRLNPIQPSLL